MKPEIYFIVDKNGRHGWWVGKIKWPFRRAYDGRFQYLSKGKNDFGNSVSKYFPNRREAIQALKKIVGNVKHYTLRQINNIGIM